VLRVLGSATESIHYMVYSFTSDPIGELLLAKRGEGLLVEGVCERTQLNAYTECHKLNSSVYRQPELLHHKVFIIDERVVVTGSYNPTANGNRRNNENILIIHSETIAALFLAEYEIVLARAG
jgi:hypothetical protein